MKKAINYIIKFSGLFFLIPFVNQMFSYNDYKMEFYSSPDITIAYYSVNTLSYFIASSLLLITVIWAIATILTNNVFIEDYIRKTITAVCASITGINLVLYITDIFNCGFNTIKFLTALFPFFFFCLCLYYDYTTKISRIIIAAVAAELTVIQVFAYIMTDFEKAFPKESIYISLICIYFALNYLLCKQPSTVLLEYAKSIKENNARNCGEQI